MLRTLVAFIAIFGFTYFALFSNYAAMLMYWWFGIFRPHEWVWWDISVLQLPTIAAGLFFFPSLINGYIPWWKNLLCYLMAGFLLLAYISAALVGCDDAAQYAVVVRTAKTATVVIVAALISSRICKTPLHILGWIFVIAVSLCLTTAKMGLAAALTGASLYDIDVGRGIFTGTNHMAMGGVMSILFMMFLIQILIYKHKEYLPGFGFRGFAINAFRLLLILLVLGIAGFIYASQSRGAAISLVFAMFIWGLLHKNYMRMVGVGLVGLALMFSVFGVSEEYTQRITSAFASENERDDSVASRPHFWEAAVLMADETPAKMGVGMGCFEIYYNLYDSSEGKYGESRSVHSSHFSILAELGYPGLIVWFSLFIVAFLKLFKMRKRWQKYVLHERHAYFFHYFANAVIALQCGFLLGGSFYEMTLNDITWMTFAMIIAVEKMSDIEYEIVQARERAMAAAAAAT